MRTNKSGQTATPGACNNTIDVNLRNDNSLSILSCQILLFFHHHPHLLHHWTCPNPLLCPELNRTMRDYQMRTVINDHDHSCWRCFYLSYMWAATGALLFVLYLRLQPSCYAHCCLHVQMSILHQSPSRRHLWEVTFLDDNLILK